MEELLHILEKNARLPVEDIAAMMGKTPAQVATMMDEACLLYTSKPASGLG